MAEGTIFEDFLWLLKARDETSLLMKAIILTKQSKRSMTDETLLEIKDRFLKKTLAEKADAVINSLSNLRNLKYDLGRMDDGRLHYIIRTQDAWKSELYIAPQEYLQYEIVMSSGWAEKPRKEYFDLELSKRTNAMEFFNDLKTFRNTGVSFEDSEKMLDQKYRSLTLYRPQKKVHYLEGVLSASPNESRDTNDYCLSLELSQIVSNNGQKNVKAVLTVDTKWNFIKKKSS